VNAILENGLRIPQDFALLQNYPNPFNSSTRIIFEVPMQSHVDIVVLDLLGNRVATLVNRDLNAGNFTTTWFATHLVSGVYFVRMEAENFNATRKVTLIR
jgi:hypothetical protein